MATLHVISLLLAWILLADSLQLCFSSNVYIVYMGRMEPSEDSDEVYRQTHQMLIAVHSGRLVIIYSCFGLILISINECFLQLF